MLVPVQDVSLGTLVKGEIDQNPFHKVLNLLHLRNTAAKGITGQAQNLERQSLCFILAEFTRHPTRLGNRRRNLTRIKLDVSPAPLLYAPKHRIPRPLIHEHKALHFGYPNGERRKSKKCFTKLDGVKAKLSFF